MTRTCVVVMGVSGCGKTTIAERLAARLGWPMAEADDFHPAANIAKMSAGTPLTDVDRGPWLAALRDWMSERDAAGEDAVAACSALKRAYRDVLREASADVRFVHLVGSIEVIGERIARRAGHFMPVSLLESQFRDLEPLGEDEDGIAIDVERTPDAIADAVIERFGLAPA